MKEEKGNMGKGKKDAASETTRGHAPLSVEKGGKEKGDNVVDELEEKDPLEELQQQHSELNDKYLRMYSEFENFRRRTAKERLDLMRTAGEDVFVMLLPVLDDFKRALDNMRSAKDIAGVKEGVELIYNKLEKELGSKGLKPMEAKGKEFDAEYHEALTQMPAPSKKQKGKVLDVIEEGYFLNDKVIRFAKVVVGS